MHQNQVNYHAAITNCIAYPPAGEGGTLLAHSHYHHSLENNNQARSLKLDHWLFPGTFQDVSYYWEIQSDNCPAQRFHQYYFAPQEFHSLHPRVLYLFSTKDKTKYVCTKHTKQDNPNKMIVTYLWCIIFLLRLNTTNLVNCITSGFWNFRFGSANFWWHYFLFV